MNTRNVTNIWKLQKKIKNTTIMVNVDIFLYNNMVMIMCSSVKVMVNYTDILYIIVFTFNLSSICEYFFTVYIADSLFSTLCINTDMSLSMCHINMNGSVLFQQQPEVEGTCHSG